MASYQEHISARGLWSLYNAATMALPIPFGSTCMYDFSDVIKALECVGLPVRDENDHSFQT